MQMVSQSNLKYSYKKEAMGAETQTHKREDTKKQQYEKGS